MEFSKDEQTCVKAARDWEMAASFSTEYFEDKQIIEAVEKLYWCAKLKPPPRIEIFDSTFAANQFLGQISSSQWNESDSRCRFSWRDRGDCVDDQLFADIKNEVQQQITDTYFRDFKYKLKRERFLRDEIVTPIRRMNQFWNLAALATYNATQEVCPLEDGVNKEFYSSLLFHCHARNPVATASAYSFYDGFLAYANFFQTIHGLRINPDLSGLEACALSTSAVSGYRNIAVAVRKPLIISRDESGRLHSETAAIRFCDNWGAYAWHGTVVPRDVVEAPQLITVKQIESETNAEVRRVMIERYGHGRYLADCGATVVHRDAFGVLYSKDQPRDEPLVMVEVINSTAESDGTFKTYYLRVPPNMRSAKQAVAWTFGLEEQNYDLKLQT